MSRVYWIPEGLVLLDDVSASYEDAMMEPQLTRLGAELERLSRMYPVAALYRRARERLQYSMSMDERARAAKECLEILENSHGVDYERALEVLEAVETT